MYVPKRLLVSTGQEPATNGKNHLPAGYYSDDDDEEDYEYDQFPPKPKLMSTATLMTPPEKLTIDHILNGERRRSTRDTSFTNLDGGAPTGAELDDSMMYRTPNDTVLRNLSNIQTSDPIGIAKQVRHLHNRVRLLEEEVQTMHNRQIFIIGVLSVYLISRGFKWIYP